MTPFVYRCSLCARTYPRDEVRYLCPECSKGYKPGMPLAGVLQAEFDYDEIRKKFDSRRPDWDLFSAVEQKHYPPFPVGNTPFFRAGRLGDELGFSQLWIKNDGLNPSGSLKDRASFLVAAEAARLGEETIVTASTGNAASALASVCAASGKKAVVFVPAAAPKAKLVQAVLYGARLVPVRGNYDDAFRLSLEYTKLKGGLNRNTAYHPLTIEGKKTAGLEIFIQNGLNPPDAIVIPMGDGVILSAIHKAFVDLKKSGLVSHLPRLVGVQAETSDAIHRYIVSGTYCNALRPDTVADSIAVIAPSNAHLARRAVIDSGGFSLTVRDDEIMDAQALLARTTGVFAEPSSAAVVAALVRQEVRCRFSSAGRIVLLITGHGLKDIGFSLARILIPEAIDATLESLETL